MIFYHENNSCRLSITIPFKYPGYKHDLNARQKDAAYFNIEVFLQGGPRNVFTLHWTTKMVGPRQK